MTKVKCYVELCNVFSRIYFEGFHSLALSIKIIHHLSLFLSLSLSPKSEFYGIISHYTQNKNQDNHHANGTVHWDINPHTL